MSVASGRPGQLDAVWGALGGPLPPQIELPAGAHFFDCQYGLDETAVAAVAATLIAASELAEARGSPRPRVALDPAHVAFAFQSERLLLAHPPVDARFPPLSQFAATRDGHIRLHAHYPHHRAALLAVLGSPPDPDAALAAVRGWRAADLEQAVVDAGGAAAKVRSAAEWHGHPQGAAVSGLSPLDFEPAASRAAPLPPPGALPCSGLRVLDLTHALAGPVATRILGALGADVLRIDSPRVHELRQQWLDGTVNKRSAFLDLDTPAGHAALHVLLANADAVVQSYRPGALVRFGLDQPTLAMKYPSLVSVSLSAWGHRGPWAGRRGFDSLVQAATGIAVACGSADAPGALPVQALDHASGYLIAAAVMRALTLRRTLGRAAHARIALVRTAEWLASRPRPATPATPLPDPDRYRVEVSSPEGPVNCIAPPGSLDGQPLAWRSGIPTPGGESAAWLGDTRDRADST